MARNEQLIRQHKIIQILERRRYGVTLEELRDAVVEELGLTSLHVRSIRRDIEALQVAGMQILTEDLATGRVWKLGRADIGLHKIAINASELIALSVGRTLMNPLMGTQYWQGIEAFWNKIREQLPAGVWEHYERFRKTLLVQDVTPKSYEKHQGVIKTINRAIQEHRVVEIEYESMNSPVRSRHIEPYGMMLSNGLLYILAMEEGVGEEKEGDERIKHWKVDRIFKALALDRWYKFDESVELESRLDHAIGAFTGDGYSVYKVLLTPAAAKWVQEEPFQANQVLEAQADGSYLLTVKANNEKGVFVRVLKLGNEAELLEPISARQNLKAWIDEMAGFYKNENRPVNEAI